MSGAARAGLKLFTSQQVESIIGEACQVLERGPGVLVENAEARGLLQEAGCREQEGRWRISESLVRKCLESAPSKIEIFDRQGELAMDLSGDEVHFDPGSAAINIIDRGDRQRREARADDIVDFTRLVDGLPNYAAQATALTPSDVPKEIGDRYRLYLALEHGRKPIVTGTFRTDGFAPMCAMLAAVRGGEQELADKPLAIFDCCPSPPLRWSDLTCQALVDCARAGVPSELVSMPLAGATAPVTLRESILQHCAESLSGVVITQLAKSGAPVIYGGAPAAFDMRHGTTPMGSMETMMIHVGYAQVGKRLGLPTHGYMALSDAKSPDYQAGMESGVGAVLAALAGINVISGPGILDYLLTQSLAKLLLDHEACGMALRLVRGIEERPCDLLSLMGDVVASGELLSHPHTRQHWRQELSVASSLIDRDAYGEWQAAGGATSQARAEAEVERRLAAADVPPLPDDVGRELDGIMRADCERLGVELPRKR